MKLLTCLFAATVVCGLTGMARADDFKLGVLDAPPTSIQYTGAPLTVAFGSCGNHTPVTDGCVTIENDTGKTLTSLMIDIVANSFTVADGDGGCLSTPGVTCSYTEIGSGVGAIYQFLFTGLDIPTASQWCDTDTFTIEEQGLSYREFPKLTVASPTPEPASLLLLATGCLMCAGLAYKRA